MHHSLSIACHAENIGFVALDTNFQNRCVCSFAVVNESMLQNPEQICCCDDFGVRKSIHVRMGLVHEIKT